MLLLSFISNYYIINVEEDNYTSFSEITGLMGYWFKALFIKGSTEMVLLEERGLFKPVESLLKQENNTFLLKTWWYLYVDIIG